MEQQSGCSLTKAQRLQIERVQNTCMKVILGKEYQSSKFARKRLKLDTLDKRRTSICLKFGIKASKHKNHSKWFKANPKPYKNLRSKQPKFRIPVCRTERFKNSAIPYLTTSINQSENQNI